MIVRDNVLVCETCGGIGFDESVLGPERCTFCDGTEGGNPPTEGEVVAYKAARKNALFIERYGGKMTEVT
jgi:hypothetical protein